MCMAPPRTAPWSLDEFRRVVHLPSSWITQRRAMQGAPWFHVWRPPGRRHGSMYGAPQDGAMVLGRIRRGGPFVQLLDNSASCYSGGAIVQCMAPAGTAPWFYVWRLPSWRHGTLTKYRWFPGLQPLTNSASCSRMAPWFNAWRLPARRHGLEDGAFPNGAMLLTSANGRTI